MKKLRYRRLKSGKFSIYVETYNPEFQKLTYNFLKLYVTKDYAKTKNIASVDIPILEEAKKKSGVVEKIEIPVYDNSLLFDFYESCYKGIVNNYDSLVNLVRKYTNNKKIKLTGITAKWLENFMIYLRTNNYSGATIENYLYQLKGILGHAQKLELINKNPFDSFVITRRKIKPKPYLKDFEIERLISAKFPGNKQIKDAFLLSYAHGLKLETLKKIKPADVKQTTKATTLIIGSTTGEKTKIVLDNISAGHLLEHYNPDKELVFEKLKQNSAVHKYIRLWGAMAGIRRLTFTHARNTFALRMLSAGIGKQRLKEKLGIKKISEVKVYQMMFEEYGYTSLQ
jgi:site-specific recombinase XerD